MITVYVWKSAIYKAVWGHTSLKIDRPANATTWDWPEGRYFSWWPSNTPRLPTTSVAYMRPKNYAQDMELEKAKETDPPKAADGIYTFLDGALDEAAANTFLDDLVRGNGSTSSWTPTAESGKAVYNFLAQNCSATVAHTLKAAAGASGVPVAWPGHFVWYPSRVDAYCWSLANAISAKLVKVDGIGMEAFDF